MHEVGAHTVIRRVLLTVFVISQIVGVGGFYLLLRHQAVVNAEQQARILLASALSVRDYTDSHILPKFKQLPADVFHEETVPSFAAQTVFRTVSNGDNAYSYRESALNPTSPKDRAMPFEVELVKRFDGAPALKELKGLRDVGNDKVFYLARPLRITDQACLSCHSTPQAAPAAMIAKYGTANGFNWKLNDTIGVQTLEIPVTNQFRQTIWSVAILSAGLMAVFAAAYFALSRSLGRMLVAPLRSLAEAADKASQSASDQPPLPREGIRELAEIARAIDRLRTSLNKAMRALADHDPGSK